MFKLTKVCLTPWFSFGKYVITVYLPELCFMSLEARIPVRSRVHRDGRRARGFLDILHVVIVLSHWMDDVKSMDFPVLGQYEFCLVIFCFIFKGTLLRGTLYLVKRWNSKVNQLSSPAANVRNWLLSWASRMGRKSRQVITRACHKLSRNWYGI
jgi:hypothetical protein